MIQEGSTFQCSQYEGNFVFKKLHCFFVNVDVAILLNSVNSNKLKLLILKRVLNQILISVNRLVAKSYFYVPVFLMEK